MRLMIVTLAAIACLAACGCEPPYDPLSTGATTAPAPKTPSKRRTMAHQLSQVRDGMTEDEVLAIVPPPDFINIREETDYQNVLRQTTEYFYGASKPSDFPVLGQIQFGDDGKVTRVYGGTGEPPDITVISEPELAPLLRVIDIAPDFYGDPYDPSKIIHVVNVLQPLGKEKALAAISEYLRIAPPTFDSTARTGLYLVLRVLFDVPADSGVMPEISEGSTFPVQMRPTRVCPRYPIALVGDVPLLLSTVYSASGESLGAESHVDYFREHGQLRAMPLRPTNHPLHILDTYQSSAEWVYVPENATNEQTPAIAHEAGRSLLIRQLLKLVEPVDERLKAITSEQFDVAPDWEAEFARARKDFERMHIEWDAENNQYRRMP